MSNVTHSQQLTRRRRRDSRHGPDKLGLSEGDHRRRCLLTFTGKINIIHSRHGCDCTNVLQLPKRSSAAVLFEPYNLEKIEKKKCAKPATKQTREVDDGPGPPNQPADPQTARRAGPPTQYANEPKNEPRNERHHGDEQMNRTKSEGHGEQRNGRKDKCGNEVTV